MNNPEIDQLTDRAWSNRMLDLQKSYQDAITLEEWSESINYKKGVADSCKILGYCYWRFSDYSLSLSHSLKAIKLYEKLGDRWAEADTLNNIGAVYMFQNDNEKRLEVNLKCKQIRLEVGDLEGVSSSEGNIGETYLAMERYEDAEKCFHEVLSDKNSSPQGLAWAHHNLGHVAKVRKDWKEALAQFLKGLEISESVNYTVLITDSYLSIVELYMAQDNQEEALKNAERALDVSREIGAKEGEKMALYYLSKIFELKKEFETSLRYHKDYHTIDMEISRDTEIERLKTAQMKVAYDKIEEQKNELIDSIRYAERIQEAVLTRDQQQTLLKDFNLLYRPKDIVSGDFYWYHEKDNHFFLCVADCTGHGVPGAFLTMLGTTYLNEIISLDEINVSPGEILENLRSRIIKALAHSNHSGARDGMDISMLKVNMDTLVCEWAGANNPLWILRDKTKTVVGSNQFRSFENENWQLIEYKADKQPIGLSEKILPFKNHRIQLEKEDVLYLFSDGFADQFGGEKGKKYKTMQFKRKLLSLQNESMELQGKLLQQEFIDWKGEQAQVDDVCVFGFKI